MTSNNNLPLIAEQLIIEEKTTQQTQTEIQAQDISWFERKIEEQAKQIRELEMLNNRQENEIKKQAKENEELKDENQKLKEFTRWLTSYNKQAVKYIYEQNQGVGEASSSSNIQETKGKEKEDK